MLENIKILIIYLILGVVTYFWCDNEDNKKKLKETLMNSTIPFYIGKFDEIIKEKGYLANVNVI